MASGASPEGNRSLLVLSVGVSDLALQRIGLIMVMGAQLDHRRMTILECATGAPIQKSAKLGREKLTRELKAAFREDPLDRIYERLVDWLSEVDDLLGIRDRYAHSVTYYQVDGVGNAGSFSLHPRSGEVSPVVSEPKLDDEVLRFSSAADLGTKLEIETGILKEDGAAAHDRYLERHQEFERRSAALYASPVQDEGEGG